MLGPHLAHDVEEALVGIALDVELASRAPGLHQLCQRRYVGAADVALVGPRMDGQSVDAGIMRDAREFQHIGDPGMPRVAQERDLVEIDAEPSHRAQFICIQRPGESRDPSFSRSNS